MRKCVSGVESAKTGWWSPKTAAAAVAAEFCPRRGGEFCRKCENGPPRGGTPRWCPNSHFPKTHATRCNARACAHACNSLRAKVLRTFSYTHVAHHTLAHTRTQRIVMYIKIFIKVFLTKTLYFDKKKLKKGGV